jgi:hypothetical protein
VHVDAGVWAHPDGRAVQPMKWNHVEAILTLVPQPCCYPGLQSWENTRPGENAYSHDDPRRTVLLGATAVGLGAAAGFRIPTSEARAPISGQVPYFYRFMVGRFKQPWSPTGRCRWESHPLR